MKTDVKTLAAKTAGTVELADDIFGLEPRADLLHRMVAWQLNKRRAGTHKVKNRSEISLTGKKMHKQKGTGGARHGSRKAPQFRGGGRAFGPHPRDHATDLPKKVRALALRHALSAKVKSSSLIVLDEARLDAPKTAALAKALGALELTSALIVDGDSVEPNFAMAVRNLPHFDLLPAAGINVYDVLRRDTLVLTKAALASIEGRFHA